MMTFVSIIHIVAALLLILLVLMQDSKSGGMGMLGGGGSSSVFGASGAANVLVKFTRFMAVLFAGTSIVLTIMTSNQNKSVVDNLVVAPVKQEAPQLPGQKTDKADKTTTNSDKK